MMLISHLVTVRFFHFLARQRHRHFGPTINLRNQTKATRGCFYFCDDKSQRSLETHNAAAAAYVASSGAGSTPFALHGWPLE